MQQGKIMWSQLQVCKFPREQTEQEICKNVKAEFGYCNLPTCATVLQEFIHLSKRSQRRHGKWVILRIHTKIVNAKSFTWLQAGFFCVFIAIITMPQFGGYPEVLPLHTTLFNGFLEKRFTAVSFCCVNMTNATFL